MTTDTQQLVHIITDSAADLTTEVSTDLGITVVPLTIRFDTEEYLDGEELSREAFWSRQALSSELPATSAPSPGRFEEAFRSAAKQGATSIVCLTISQKLSGTYQIACSAATAVEDVIPVHIVDTQACSIAQGLLCSTAATMARNGRSAEEIVAHIDEIKSRTPIFGALDTLENLKKGGRIGAANAFFGALLSVKPIVGLVDGEVKAVARARTHSKAVDHLLDVVRDNLPLEDVVVAHSGAPDIEEFTASVAQITGLAIKPATLIGPVVGTHTGARLLAVAFTKQHS